MWLLVVLVYYLDTTADIQAEFEINRRSASNRKHNIFLRITGTRVCPRRSITYQLINILLNKVYFHETFSEHAMFVAIKMQSVFILIIMVKVIFAC